MNILTPILAVSNTVAGVAFLVALGVVLFFVFKKMKKSDDAGSGNSGGEGSGGLG